MRTLAVVILGMALSGADATKCPISGKDAKDEFFLDVNGKKVLFCCDKCPKAYAKKLGVVDEGPKKCALGDDQAAKDETKLIRTKAAMVYFCCDKCPKTYSEKEHLVSVDKGAKKCAACDKDASADHSIVVNGEKTYFCCEDCKKGFLTKSNVVDKGPDKCPVSNHAAKKETGMVRITAEALYFCCNNCKGKYVEKNLKEEKHEGKGKAKID